MADYEEFLPAQRLGKALSLSADGLMVAYTSDQSGQFNLWVQPVDGGPPRQVTSYTDQAVREVAWSPDGSLLAFTADTCGDEDYQVYVVSAAGGVPTRVTSGSGQHFLAEKSPFDLTGRYLMYSGPDAESALPDIFLHDLAGESGAHFLGPTGTLGFAIAASPDGRLVLGAFVGSNTECQCYLAEAGKAGTALEAVTASLPGEYYYPGPWAGDGSGFYVLTTDADDDHVSLGFLSLPDRILSMLDSPAWNVEDIVVSADGRTVVWSVNVDGYSVLHARRDGAVLEVPAAPGGVIRAMNISADGSVLALLLDTPTWPTAIAVGRLGGDEPFRYLTDTRAPAVQVASPVSPELIRFNSEDGTCIPALLYRPAGPGPFPVLVSVHGGPEQQARPDYKALHQALLASGIAVLVPNIRGSSGYGHAWQRQIYRDWGGVDLADLGAAHAWLVGQAWVDPRRIAVYGMSYGGFAALSCITRQPQLWAAGVSVCGPSNLDWLARSMPPSWAATVAAMFGDLDDPGDAAELRLRSPLTYAEQISAPLLVVQGATDPRVPKGESDQIIDAARANGADAQYLVFDDEGHGFTSRDNDVKANAAIVEFLTEQLRS